jgi:hypothetical protein
LTRIADDHSPIQFHDSSPHLPVSTDERSRVAGPAAFILLSHAGFSVIGGQLAVQKVDTRAQTFGPDASNNRFTLESPWTLSLNYGEVLLVSFDNKTIFIQPFADYDLAPDSSDTTLINLTIGSRDLTSAVLFSPFSVTRIDLPANHSLFIDFA